MRDDSPQWQEVGPPATPAEAEALRAVKALLPDAPTCWAWSNLAFLDLGGRSHETDVLLLTRSGLYLVELKGWFGPITGNQQVWQMPGKVEKNPYFANDGKAKRLRSLLSAQAASKKGVSVPFIHSIVVLHGKGCQVKLDAVAKSHVYGLDGYDVTGVPAFSQFLDSPLLDGANAVDKPRAKQLVDLIKAAGFVPIPRVRKVGDYAVESGEPFDEGPSWHDVIAENSNMPGVKRRVRLYDVPLSATTEQRAAIKRMAQRELLLTHSMQLPGIVKPLELFDSQQGPALVFEHDPSAVPLLTYLDDHRETLGFDDRLRLVRKVAEVLRYAHSRQVSHRSLTPKQVYVVERPGEPPLVTVRDWQTGRAAPGDEGTATGATLLQGTRHVAQLTGQDAWIYLAPETHTAQNPDGYLLDVFSLGALSFLILTGEPPAQSFVDFEAKLREGHGLDPAVVLDGFEEPLRELVMDATHPDARLDRTPSVDAFLQQLDDAEKTLAEAAVQQPSHDVDPLEAQYGDLLDIGGAPYFVEERLGSGSTGVALLVDDTENPKRVLKVAHDTSKAQRIDDEYAVLASLDSPRIVKPLRDPVDVRGRRAVLLEDAGRPTLGTRVRDEGRLTLDQLQRYGADLLEAVDYLTKQGVFHRDIKPDNLGVRPDPGDRRPRLVLFDFSLSKEPLDQVKAGTRPYLDPFLGGARRSQYDSAAERWAVAVTLFIMATGQLPQWGSGDVDPAVIEDEVSLSASLFEPSVSTAMVAFFRTALARDVGQRFAELTELAQAWEAVFRAADTRVGDTLESNDADRAEANDAAAASATLTTPLEQSGLTARAQSVTTRLGATTVGELLAINAMSINQVPGSGDATRREIQRRVREWRRRLAPTSPGVAPDDTEAEATANGARSIDAIARSLVPGKAARSSTNVTTARLLLGIPVEHQGEPGFLTEQPWPSAQDVADVLDMTRVRVTQLLDGLRPAWAKTTVASGLADEVADSLALLGGLAEVDELARTLLATHGSVADEPARTRQAFGVVRAVVEGDFARGGEARFGTRRTSGGVLVALESVAASDPAAQDLLDFGKQLGTAADRVCGSMPTRSESVAVLRAVEAPLGYALADERLLQVAAAASTTSAVSGRGELYPRGLAADSALRITLAGVSLRGLALTPAALDQRVRSRFPGGQPLPARPALDDLVESAGLGLRWNGSAYSAPTEATTGLLRTQHASTMLGLHLPEAQPYDEVDARLQFSIDSASYLTLAADPRRIDDAVAALTQRYAVQHVDLTRELLSGLHSLTDGKVEWPFVLGSDAADAGSADRTGLDNAVRRALQARIDELLTRPEPLLLTGVGILGRYRAEGWIADLANLATQRPASRWLLVPMRAASAAPLLDDNVAVPLGADGWLMLPPDLTAPIRSENAS